MEQNKHAVEAKVYLTIQEVSSYLNIKAKTLYAMVSAGEIQHYRIGRLLRFTKEHIDAWLETKKVAPQSGQTRTKRSAKKSVFNIDSIVRKTIDAAKGKDYTIDGKSGHVKDLGKEVKNGTI